MKPPKAPVPAFLTELATKSAPDIGPRFVRFTEELRYYSRILGTVLVVPVGFPSDLATFCIKDLCLRGQTDKPAGIHDLGYAIGDRSRFAWDLIFYEACRAEGMGKIRAGIRFLAVRLFGFNAWRNHRKGRSPAVKWLRQNELMPKVSAEKQTQNHP